MKNDVIVGLGSNIDALIHIEKAVQLIEKEAENGATELKRARIVETTPLGFKDQANFFNSAIRFKTVLDPKALKNRLLEIENALGRVRTNNKNGPRTIDLDILVWNGEIVDYDVAERDFLQEAIEALQPGLIRKLIEK
ncbi:MAG: 2-amino-4-hydroxy-6-hydroxymethyldihydropteridine diphosphokinase [Nitrospiria bacterium]